MVGDEIWALAYERDQLIDGQVASGELAEEPPADFVRQEGQELGRPGAPGSAGNTRKAHGMID